MKAAEAEMPIEEGFDRSPRKLYNKTAERSRQIDQAMASIKVVVAFALACGLGGLSWQDARPGQGGTSPATPPAVEPGKITPLLKEIFNEVLELGPRRGEDIIRQEFFVGEGDDDTYKDYHLVVLIQEIPGRRKMTLQVTRLVPDPDAPRVKYGRDPKLVICLVEGDRLQVSRKDYSEKELASLLPDLLRAIQDRKRLIRDRTPAPARGSGTTGTIFP